MTEFPPEWARMRVVLVHDWLTGMRGGERVLEVLCRGFPEAPVLTLIHAPQAVSPEINRHAVQASWLRHVPGIARHYRQLLPLFPVAIETLKAPPADLVISTSHCVAKGIRPPDGARHLCYCFTPMRYAWLFYNEYFGGSTLKAAAARCVLPFLRRWDRTASRRVDRFVAISRHVQERIRRFYGRDADVVYPPVDTDRCTPGGNGPGRYDLIVSALVPYKRIDLACRAYTRTGFPLKIVGTGSDYPSLTRMAGPNVQFLGWQTDEAVLELYRGCRMLVFPGEEDFGIVPLEAQACGRPVVAFGRGGAVETVRDGVSGVHFSEQTEAALSAAVERCAARAWDPAAIRANAERFSVKNFIAGMDGSISRAMSGASLP